MKTFIFLFNLLLLAFLVKGSVVPGVQGDKIVLCYYDGLSPVQHEEEESLAPEDLDVTICTHVVYSKAVVNRDLEVEPRMSMVDLDEDDGLGKYNRTLALKKLNPGLKVFIDVIDRHEALGKQARSENRSAVVTFSKNAADYVQKYGFDGMHFVMRNPEGLHEIAPILREEFARRELPVMTFIMPSENPSEPRFVMTEDFSRNFDYIVVGSYMNLPKEHAVIVSSMESLESVVGGYRAMGVPAEKLLVPIPAFSITMKLCNKTETGIGSGLCSDGDEGTKAQDSKMFLHNSEMRKKMANTSEEWVVVRDEVSKVPYGYSKSLQWASFEDPESVREKAKYIRENNLAGAAIMSVDMEDFRGQYTEGGETFPLTRALFNALNGQT